MAKKIKITTIKDILENVNSENTERFLNDFLIFLALSIDMKERNPEVIVESMIWKDDGIHEPTGITYNGKLIKIKKSKK